MTLSAAFGISAIVLLAGFAGRILFEKTRVPDIPVLLGIGVALGPGLHILDRSVLLPLAPYLGMLTLLMIMLEGGMDLEIRQVMNQWKRALILTFLTVTLATVAVAAGYLLMTGSGLLPSLLLGSILGCTSGAIVIPLVNAMRMGKNTRTILTLEAALGDAMAVIAVVVLVRYTLQPSSNITGQILATAGSILGGVLLGTLGGLLWVKVLERTGEMPLSYMITLAAVFLFFSAAESLHFSGVIGVLFFGVALSNGPAILSRIPALKEKDDWSASRSALDGTIRWFHEELTFIARVFFFVYLGMLLDWSSVSGRFLAVSAALICLIYVSRFASVQIVSLTGRRLVPFERKIMTTMGPRGLASAVLAMMPEAAGIPGTGIFVQYAFAVILVTNLLVTFAVLRSERRIDMMLAENPPPPPTVPGGVP